MQAFNKSKVIKANLDDDEFWFEIKMGKCGLEDEDFKSITTAYSRTYASAQNRDKAMLSFMKLNGFKLNKEVK